MVRVVALLAVCSVLACACVDVCQRADAVAKTFSAKTASCSEVSTMPFDVTACEASLSRCSTVDLETVSAWYDCLDRLPSCTQADSATFSASVLKCANHMTELSPGCFAQ